MAYTQQHRMMRVSTPLGSDELLITAFSGREEISRLFQFELTLISSNHRIAFEEIIGRSVTLTLVLADGEERHFNGLVAAFSQKNSNILTEIRGEVFAEYTATIVPWFWLLTKTADLRIFQEKSVVEIIEQIFSEKGFRDYTKKLTGSYQPRTYCVQYRETDFAFCSRLMEEEGISYYFRHEDGRHTLVLADSANSYQPCSHYEHVRYQLSSQGGDLLTEDLIKTLEVSNQIRVGKISLNDYNFETPSTPLLVETQSSRNLGPGEREVYDYPGGFGKRAQGDSLSHVRIEEEEAAIVTISGTSDVRGFASGSYFTLEEHFRDEMNNKKYLLTAVEHHADQVGYRSNDPGENHYRNTFTCIPYDTPYRPPRLTKKPVVEGVQTAVVVGPAGEEIYTDKYGRIKVQFHWDREGSSNEHSSCWMRVSQYWAGASWGALYIPRIGHEVIVDFLEGDPDQPIVVGSVYHGLNMPPYPLPDDKTKSTLKSNSTKGGGGFNELRFEDKKGSEEIYLHGQKNWDIMIRHNKSQVIGHDETMRVVNNRTKTVGVNQMETIGANKTITVGGAHAETIGGSMALTVGANKTETVAVNSMETIGAAKELTIGGAYQVTVGGVMNQSVGGASAEEVGGSKALAIGGSYTLSVGDSVKVENGSSMISMDSGGKIEISGTDVTFQTAGGKVHIDSGGIITIKGAMVKINT